MAFGIEEAVARELIEHMVEKADARGDLRNARAVEIELRRDPGLARIALDRGVAGTVRTLNGGGSARGGGAGFRL